MQSLTSHIDQAKLAARFAWVCLIGLAVNACSFSSKIDTAHETQSNPSTESDIIIHAKTITESPPSPIALQSPMELAMEMPVAPPPYIPPSGSPNPTNAMAKVKADFDSHQYPTSSTAKYPSYKENNWKLVSEEPLSTFSADVDTGSYANVRRFIQQGQLPPPDAVRAEELINYFSYNYALPSKDAPHPFSVHTQLSLSPWNSAHQLVRIAIKGKDLAKESLPSANLVFLVDVSGSMASSERLPLIKSALKLLTAQLRPQDRVSLVTYANGTRLALAATPGDQKHQIKLAIDQLSAGGGTNGAAGIKLAYAQAHSAYIPNGINRVLLATDGDLNIGVTNQDELKALVERERKTGISLSTLGVGDDNYNEALMKKLADNGDGSYHYLDSLQEAHKVLVNEFTSTLSTIAQDLKLQIEFNPALVQEYRLIGYEARALNHEQFNDDQVDAADIGAGHTVTALYEISLKGAKGHRDTLRYRANDTKAKENHADGNANELAWLKLRYKQVREHRSELIEIPILADRAVKAINLADQDFRFATAVAAWAQWLRGSSLIGDFGPEQILALARSAADHDHFGRRAEWIRLVELSAALHPTNADHSRQSHTTAPTLNSGTTQSIP
ncbi:vWA domain-containing protein [Undibacterium fentianense]|uniref:VWA domain-containing protein n=1 Tax=Undibacterium fentianense TaxID=2828728 RepID=A0A941E566_9BURK|nr:VWA domain-containing protein [Undibacterium fentianense]MBR7801367.1 VWA domain-containing protein [Undibacterium fentianense]